MVMTPAPDRWTDFMSRRVLHQRSDTDRILRSVACSGAAGGVFCREDSHAADPANASAVETTVSPSDVRSRGSSARWRASAEDVLALRAWRSGCGHGAARFAVRQRSWKTTAL